MIPIPPSHCVKQRQMFTLWGSDSTSRITLAPVVVKPDIDSKKASVKLLAAPHNRNAMPEKTENHTQMEATIR